MNNRKIILFFDKKLLKNILRTANININNGIGGNMMKYYGEKSLSEILGLVMNFTIVFGMFLTAALGYNTLSKGDSGEFNFELWQGSLVVALLVVGISCLFLIVFNLKKIIGTLVKADPFVRENVVAFKRISIQSFIISMCYFINLLVNYNLKEFKFIYVDNSGIHTDMEFLIFLFAGIFIFILAKVFEQAIKYKEDNDLTI